MKANAPIFEIELKRFDMKETLKNFLIPEEVPGKTNIGHPFETHDPIYGLPSKRILKDETATAAKPTDTTPLKDK